MSDVPQSDRTEPATPQRRKQAAEKGQIPRSREVNTALLLLASGAALKIAGPALATDIVDVFHMSVTALSAPSGPANALALATHIGWATLRALLPIPLGLAAVALFVGALQGRGILTTEPLTPKLNRLDPMAKAKQIWGFQALAEFGKSLTKLAVLAFALYFPVRRAVAELPGLAQTGPAALGNFIGRWSTTVLFYVGLAYLTIAAIDYAVQIWQHERKIRMTREEVKREIKDSEGDQTLKVRRRTIARQLAHQRMMGDVSEADVVVTNPTHIAVALKYDPDVAHAPIVLAMGERKIAQRIKQLAKDSGVPVVENKPLARALYATATVGTTIPMDLFIAVAEILAFVYRMHGSAARYGAD